MSRRSERKMSMTMIASEGRAVSGSRRGFLAGCFDPFPHPGVLRAMEQATYACSLSGIIVGLHIDPSLERPEKAKNVMTIAERLVMLRALRWVTGIHLYERESDLLALLKSVKPDVRIMGEDYKGKTFTGDELEIPVFYATRYPEWSATEFKNRITASQSVT